MSLNYGDENRPIEILKSHLKNNYILISSTEMLTLIPDIHLWIWSFPTFEDEYCESLTLLKRIGYITTSNTVYSLSRFMWWFIWRYSYLWTAPIVSFYWATDGIKAYMIYDVPLKRSQEYLSSGATTVSNYLHPMFTFLKQSYNSSFYYACFFAN